MKWRSTRKIYNIRYADDTALLVDSEELQRLLDSEATERGGDWFSVQQTESAMFGCF